MGRKLCAFIVDGKECRCEMTEELSLSGLLGFRCPLGHQWYKTAAGTEIRFQRSLFNGEAWHFSHDCSQWPETNAVSVTYISSEAAICVECLAKGGVARG
jgi:hypothetical protein